MSLTIKLAGEEVALLPERGLFWVRESMLLIADWHVGKAASLRAAGIGVPEGDLAEEFGRLDTMIEKTGAAELVILGDFAHARAGLNPRLLGMIGDWIGRSGVRASLVSGNHDRSAGVDRACLDGLDLLGDGLVQEPFVLRHEPEKSEGGYVLAGHIHPAVRLGEGKP